MISIGCDMCGKPEQSFETSIEGSTVKVCESCSRYGKNQKRIVTRPEKSFKPPISAKPSESVISIASDYGTQIRKKRESIGLTQEQLAQQIKEKLSLIHKIETNNFDMDMSLAKKIERSLKLSLIREEVLQEVEIKETSDETFTLGDYVKIK